jgi:deoxycytidylate deaminase
LILENDSISAKELNLVEQLLEIFLQNQEIKTIPIAIDKLPNLSIGIIAEFGFPVNDLVIILKEQLMVFGYQDSDIVDTMLTQYDVNSRKIQIITNIESREDIKKLKTEAKNKFILIGAGLEYGLSSICRTRLVNVYNKRFEGRDSCNADDFKKIAANLKKSDYITLSESVNKCFHQADLFINYLSDEDINKSLIKMKHETERFLELIFGKQYITPTQDEFMMYMAFTSALRSADLSRQVGAVITSKHGDIIASGTNDIPKSGGGLYWSTNNNGFNYEEPLGRDIARGFDSNAVEKVKIFDNLHQMLNEQLKESVSKEEFVKHLLNAKGNLLNDITEYGRVVHAEMEALLSCTRNGVSTIGGTLFCTTYPCHNCAKHIIAAGISRVVYIEPYSKSKAIDFHFESVNHDNKSLDKLEGTIDVGQKKVSFESFAGIGPRLFREVFVLGNRKRKTDDTENYQEFGYVLKKWTPELITSLS